MAASDAIQISGFETSTPTARMSASVDATVTGVAYFEVLKYERYLWQ